MFYHRGHYQKANAVLSIDISSGSFSQENGLYKYP